MTLFEADNQMRNLNDMLLCGVDEAGRGPLAGPVFAAAVILPADLIIDEINDSKKLSAKKREQLFDVIIQKALSYSIVSIDEKTIDEINILNATMKAMTLSINKLSLTPQKVIIDGNKVPSGLENAQCVIGGDAKHACIAAASILAKVSRDKFMLEMTKRYPQYQFEKHKGYGTKLHYQLLQEYGISPIHRRSFLKNLSEHYE